MDTSYKVTILENGLRIATTPMPGMNSVSLGVWLGCGSRYEDEALNGISHFIEHLVFKGTRKRSGEEISEKIEGVGGEMNASTSEESTIYYVKVIKDKMPLSLEVLLDMVINPLFKNEYLEKQREIVFEEIHMYEDTPANHVEDLFNSMLWKGHPLGLNILGTIDSMKKLSRKEIVGYKQEMYRSNNCVVTAAGDIDHEDFVKLVRKYTRNLRSGKNIKPQPVRSKQSKPRLLIERRNTEQAHVLLGIPALRWTSPDRFCLKIISTILGENMSSRLYTSVREEKGYAYSINTGMDRFIDAGAFYVAAGVMTEKMVPAMRLVLREMARIAKTKVPGKELERAKEYIRGGMIMGAENTMARMHWLGDSLRMANRINPIDKTIDAVMNVSADEVLGLAKRLFKSERLNLALIADIRNEAPIEKILRFP